MLVLSHKIRIKNPTVKQEQYFRQACGTYSEAYNWGLASLQKQYKTGFKPTARTVRAAFNACKLADFPWVCHQMCSRTSVY
mgnify:CR=1 FL=1